MPLINLPKIGPVNFRDNLSKEDFNKELQRLATKYDFELPKIDYGLAGSFTKGVSRGLTRMGETFGDIIPAMGAHALGFDEYARKQMGEAAETERQLADSNPAQFKSYKDVHGLGDAARFGLETVGEQVPNIAAALVPGGVGGALARRGAVGAAEAEMASIAPSLLESGATAQEMAQVTGRVLAEQQAGRSATGQAIGTYLGSYALNAPEIFQNIYDSTGKMDDGAALLAGSVSAALDSVLPATILRKITGPSKAGIVEAVLTKSGMEPSLARSVTASVVEGAVSEGVTEGVQEAISIAAEKYVAGNPQIFDSKDWHRIVDSSIKGSVGGGAFGIAGGVGQRAQDRGVERAQEAKTQSEIDAINQERAMRDEEIARLQAANLPQEAPAPVETTPLGLPPARNETLVAFPDGSVGTQAEADAFIANLPEEQQNEARAKMAGLPYSTPPRMVITDADLKEFGISKTTVAARQLRELNVSTYENRDLMQQVLDANKDKIKNPEAVQAFLERLPIPTNYSAAVVQDMVTNAEQQFTNSTQIKKFLINEIGEDNFNTLKNEDPKILSKLLKASKAKPQEVQDAGITEGVAEGVDGTSADISGQSITEEPNAGIGETDGSTMAGAPADVGGVSTGEVQEPTALDQAPEVQAEEAQVETPQLPSQAPNPWLALSEMGQEQQAYDESRWGTKSRPAEPVEEVDDLSEEALAKDKATLSAFGRQKFSGVKNIVPEDQVSLDQAMTALANIMYHYVKKGVRSMRDAIRQAKKDMAGKANAITQAQYEQAFTTALNRVDDEVASTGFNPTAAKSTVNSIGETIQSFIPGSQSVYDNARDTMSTLKPGVRKIMLGFYSLNDLSDVYGDYIPALKELSDVLGKRAKDAYDRRLNVEKLVSEGAKLAKQFSPATFKHFNNITLRMSVENVDPRDPKDSDNTLYKEYKKLPKELQDLGIMYANEYDKYADEFLKLITETNPEAMGRDFNTQAEKVRKKFESGRVKFYHPLRRSGNYWLSYNDKSGERVVIARETPNQIQEEMNAARLAGGKEFKQYSKISQVSYREAPPTGFIGEILGNMAKAGVSPDVLDQTYQSYLSLFPAASLRKQFMKRAGDQGYIEDVVQGFADVGSKMANQLSQLKYRPDLDKLYTSMQEDVNAYPTKELVDVYDEMMKRKEFVENPIADTLSSRAGYISYFWNIAGNVSSAAINLTQLPLVVMPLLSGSHGLGATFKAMKNATKIYMNGGMDTNREFLPDFTADKNTSLSSEHKALFEAALSTAALRRGAGYELTDMRRTKTEDYTGLKAKVETGLGWVFQNSERANREITLLAAYDLARNSGKSAEEATKYAIKLMIDAHGNSLSEAGPRMFQNGLGKIAFTFKHFAQTQIALQAKLFNRAFKDEDPMVRKLAQKQLLGIYGTSFAFAGVQGMPLYGAATTMAEMLHALLGDDDEPFDPDEEVREAIGALGYKGPLNQILGIDIASRTGFNNMFWREDPRRLAEVGMAPYIAEHFFGPSYQTLFVNPVRAKDLFDQGQTERAIETLMPSFIKNPMKAIRFGTEGALTSDGAKIVDDYSAYSSLMQILGFSNAELAEAYARAGSMKAAEKQITSRRQALLNGMYVARVAGDFESENAIQENIDSFNEKFPGMPITEKNLQASYKQHQKRIEESVDGVYINAKLRDQIIDEWGN